MDRLLTLELRLNGHTQIYLLMKTQVSENIDLEPLRP